MSIMRISGEARWFDVSPDYTYVMGPSDGAGGFNHGIRSVLYFCEIAMRSLEQSGELDDGTLADCQRALQERYYLDDDVLLGPDARRDRR